MPANGRDARKRAGSSVLLVAPSARGENRLLVGGQTVLSDVKKRAGRLVDWEREKEKEGEGGGRREEGGDSKGPRALRVTGYLDI